MESSSVERLIEGRDERAGSTSKYNNNKNNTRSEENAKTVTTTQKMKLT